MTDDDERLLTELLEGKHRALARVISKIENHSPGYRDLVSQLHAHTGDADVIGITGSPGAGKSTLVDKLAKTYRDRGHTVGVIAIDPSSPFTGGAVLGDRIRMASNVGDMDVFFRSMSARGSLGGLSTATTDAVRALDAFGKDKIIIETVGAGQNEIDIVKTADTVAVLVPPGSGDDIQMLKAGILEIADVFVVNKADKDGADMTVTELREMIMVASDAPDTGHHGPDAMADYDLDLDGTGEDDWTPPIVETVATDAAGVDDLLETFDDHVSWLAETGELETSARRRYAEEIRTLLREDTAELLADELEARGGLEAYVDAVVAKESDPYTIADEVLEPFETCLGELRAEGRATVGNDGQPN
ncbi:methylmalonyl Co-A mutase-associated GTPase MeaB [Natrarchaeobaculum sulfurireducens]|uniref:Putative periplasmic protein kinase ArgK andrelated GTPases of G3E family n=1 Tax=Natrarchaeobaculum sulfurireducens TaxID=2044521 RepID=A0A346PU45_9EURY|nr:methylmalonyl Co-A mutase-associated GTPase MeaB [Natrarchaeobaculum sulfurireducens]AXR83040.1 putative periplasmic protein kinase ArgK andrelated GTPases of G3E family [Natrarchaeobaculum sulfurireducens]